jgi:hypothetical protein
VTYAPPDTTYLTEQAARLLGDTFAPLLPLQAGTAAALSEVAAAVETWADSATIATSEGAWLDLLARGFGLYREAGESDADLRLRIGRVPKALTPAAMEQAVNAIITPDSCTVVEHWKARVFCDDHADEYVTDLFCDEDTVLGVRNGVTVICPEGLTDAVELAVCAVLNDLRAAGVRVWVVFDDDLDEVVMGLDLEEP